MRLSSLLASSTLLLAASYVAAADSDVIDLTPDNFSSVVDKDPLVLVEFFAPWCGHCKALAPQYEEAATALKDKGIKLAKVDCVEQAELCQKNGVQGYPTLKVYNKGKPSPYSGQRNTEGIIAYMIKQSLPAVSDVRDFSFDEFISADKIVVMAFLASETDAPGPQFTETANKHRDDWLFGSTTDEKVIEKAGVKPPAVVLFRKFDEPRVEYKGDASKLQVADFEAFIKDNAIPILGEVNAQNYQMYAESGMPLAYLFLDPSDEAKDERIAALKPIATKHKGKLNFVWIDAVKFGDHARALNLKEAKWPSFVVQDLAKQLKYPHTQITEPTAESMEEIVEQYLAGTLEPALKSEAVPETQDESVYVVVGKSFEEVVFDDSKDVFIEFYAPWCGHCKRLKPTWDSLGDRYASVKDKIIIAKMDATENDLPESVPFRISGFPTLKLRPAGSREFIDYDGDRSLESLIEFVEEKAKNDLTPPPSAKEDDAAQSPLAEESHAATSTPASTESPAAEAHDEL